MIEEEGSGEEKTRGTRETHQADQEQPYRNRKTRPQRKERIFLQSVVRKKVNSDRGQGGFRAFEEFRFLWDC
jgi:hypothetical protein